MTIHVGIIGATGYAGAELCRLLLAAPGRPSLPRLGSESFAGQKLSEVYPSLPGALRPRL